MKNKLILLAGIALLTLSSSAMGAVSPLSVAIVPPVQFPPQDFNVAGLRVSALWGKHRQMYGFDFGAIGNITDQSFVGLAVGGLFNSTGGASTILGLQATAGLNINRQKTSVYGAQIALVNSNLATSSVVGIQVGAAANLSGHTKIYGLQVGLYNHAEEVFGFQIGLINKTTSLHGLQIGLINFHEKGIFSVCPIINVGF
jgi:hypothetical protein